MADKRNPSTSSSLFGRLVKLMRLSYFQHALIGGCSEPAFSALFQQPPPLPRPQGACAPMNHAATRTAHRMPPRIASCFLLRFTSRVCQPVGQVPRVKFGLAGENKRPTSFTQWAFVKQRFRLLLFSHHFNHLQHQLRYRNSDRNNCQGSHRWPF
jgi:hypothetical protein